MLMTSVPKFPVQSFLFGGAGLGIAAGLLGSKLLGGGKSGAENGLNQYATLPYDDPKIQAFLPPVLRNGAGGAIPTGIENIRRRLEMPGALSGTVAQAIAPRLAAESDQLAANFRNMRANQMGGAARSNLPLSIRQSLSDALDLAQARAQGGIRREALMDSEQLRRGDENQFFNLLDAVLQFTSAGRGQAIQGLGSAASHQANRQGSNLGFIGSLVSSLSGLGKD